MTKLEETNLIVDYLNHLGETGVHVDNTIMLIDIAKSLAMIVDKLYEKKKVRWKK